jgi:hypothetical protein
MALKQGFEGKLLSGAPVFCPGQLREKPPKSVTFASALAKVTAALAAPENEGIRKQ